MGGCAGGGECGLGRGVVTSGDCGREGVSEVLVARARRRTVEKDNITLLSAFDFVWLEYGRAVVCGVVAYSNVPLLDGVRGGRACEERGGL